VPAIAVVEATSATEAAVVNEAVGVTNVTVPVPVTDEDSSPVPVAVIVAVSAAES
jgi:hypothetical protein